MVGGGGLIVNQKSCASTKTKDVGLSPKERGESPQTGAKPGATWITQGPTSCRKRVPSAGGLCIFSAERAHLQVVRKAESDESESSDGTLDECASGRRILPTAGLQQIVDGLPDYARFECPDGEATFSLHRVERVREGPGVVVYFECENLDASVDELKSKGIRFDAEPR